jgi:hypothetical protein
VILDPTNDWENFTINGNNYEVVGFITTYISWEIHFDISGIDIPPQFWEKLKSLLNRVDEIHVMQLEKKLIFLYPHSFEKMKDYLVHVK